MSEVSISVLGDPDSLTGGEAIIRLTGVGLVPPGSTFRIEPIEADTVGRAREGWPEGELRPVGLRITSDGVDMLIGRDVVDAPALVPGTPVTITVAAVDARAELRWPQLPGSKAPRGGGAIEDGEHRVASDGLSPQDEPQAATNTNPVLGTAPAEVQSMAAEAAADVEGDRGRLLRTLTTEAEHVGVTRAVPTPPPPKIPPPPRVVPLSSPQASMLPGTAPRDDSPPPPPVARKPPASTVAQPSPARSERTTGRNAAKAETQMAPVPLVLPTANTSPAEKARGGWSGKLLWFALGCIVTGAATVAMLGRQAPPMPRLPITPPSSTAAGPVPEIGKPDRTGPSALPKLAAILDVPLRSPLGHATEGVDLDEALKRADAELSGPAGERDIGEAKFWLRRALGLGLGNQRLVWALTQLGTLYANAQGSPADYDSARLLWELAAAKGDTVALCFLASMHEHGLGIASDRQQALALYERAKGLGGCRGVDDAISRLRPEK
ncbi:MAG: tetratricopeptide repeat protein [Hyphomicrobiaceae bacterium]|nr:tetratricopeptide repeat protein [Hyphomicrobiaceae bacterium]